MIRKLLCKPCGMKPALEPEDVALGWQSRKTIIEAPEVPRDHGLVINGLFGPMDSLFCDYCGADIRGTAVALTQWREEREGEPGFWETDYGAKS